MKYIIALFLLAIVACGNDEASPSLNGKWYVNDPQGIVTGWFEIKGQMVVAGQMTTSVNGSTFNVITPKEIKVDQIIVDNDPYQPYEIVVFEDYVPNSSFTVMSVGILVVRNYSTGEYEHYRNTSLTLER